MCDDATESKIDALRCLTTNLALGVRGPDRGIEPEPQFLYPNEFLKFDACADVPMRWRQLVAVAIYTYGRDAELRALECADVDLEHQGVRFTKALDKRASPPVPKPTKGKVNRTIPVEAPVAPLLKLLKHARSDAGRLVDHMFPSERDMARGLRRWLFKAGVRRHELHNDSGTTAKLRFHDLRATGITWMAVRGDDPVKIQRRAGHKDLETTQRYIRIAEDHGSGFGDSSPTCLQTYSGRARSLMAARLRKSRLRRRLPQLLSPELPQAA
jgi:integrase